MERPSRAGASRGSRANKPRARLACFEAHNISAAISADTKDENGFGSVCVPTIARGIASYDTRNATKRWKVRKSGKSVFPYCESGSEIEKTKKVAEYEIADFPDFPTFRSLAAMGFRDGSKGVRLPALRVSTSRAAGLPCRAAFL